MPIIEQQKTIYTCSDGAEFTSKEDAKVHEGRLDVQAVAEKHGYSADRFDRGLFADLLLEHAVEIHEALDGYVRALAAKQALVADGRDTLSVARIGTTEGVERR